MSDNRSLNAYSQVKASPASRQTAPVCQKTGQGDASCKTAARLLQKIIEGLSLENRHLCFIRRPEVRVTRPVEAAKSAVPEVVDKPLKKTTDSP
jgi:ribosome biogenesis SPOUT family RNA methylase Rps3